LMAHHLQLQKESRKWQGERDGWIECPPFFTPMPETIENSRHLRTPKHQAPARCLVFYSLGVFATLREMLFSAHSAPRREKEFLHY